MNPMNRITEASSMAGIGLIVQALPALLVNRADPMAWGGVIAGVLAILKRERGAA